MTKFYLYWSMNQQLSEKILLCYLRHGWVL